MPGKYGEAETVIDRLTWICSEYHGVVALEEERLIGFMIGMVIPEFKCSNKGVYVPEWGHGAIVEGQKYIYDKMYTHLADKWADEGCVSTAISILANEKEKIDQWFWNCFGMFVVDGARRLELIPHKNNPDITIRHADENDIEDLIPLLKEHDEYMRGATTFLDHESGDEKERIKNSLTEEGRTVWLAIHNGEIIGMMNSQVNSDDACTIVQDVGTVSILTTHVKKQYKGFGVGKQMVNEVINWGVENGYERCSVDFESANMEARRFWTKHFDVVCCSLIRYIDDRLVKK